MANMVTLTGTFEDAAGTPMTGSVLFSLAAAATDGATVYTDAPVRVTLDAAGEFTVDLEATDDLTVNGNTYQVQEIFPGQARRTYWIELPSDTNPANIADLTAWSRPPFVTADPTLAASNVGLNAHIADHDQVHGYPDVTITLAAMTADPVGALQAAVDGLETAQGGIIRLPRGTFELDSTVVLEGATQTDGWGSGGIQIVGAGIRGTNLVGPVGDVALQLGSATSKLAFAFRDLTLSGAGSTDTGSIGIDSRTTGGSYVFDNVLVTGFEIGIRYYDNTLVDARHLNVRLCGTGLAMGYYSDVHHYSACRFDQCTTGVYVGYFDSARSQVSPTESHASSFVNCIANQNGVSFYIRGSSTEAITLDTCYIEQYSDVGIRVGDAAGASSVSAVVDVRNCFFNGDRQIAPTGKVDHAVEVNNAFNVRVRGGGYRNHNVTPINVRNVAARVTVEPGSFSTASGETGTVQTYDSAVYTVGTDRPLNIGRVSNPVNIAASTPTASVNYDGAKLRVSGVTYECGSDGVGGYAWHAQPTALRGSQLTSGSFYPSVFLSAGQLETCDGSPTLGKTFTRWVTWACATGVDSGVGTAFKVPTDWATVNVDVLWSVTSGSGNVVWTVQIPSAAADADLTATQVSNNPAIAVPTGNALKVTRAITGTSVTPADLQGLRVYRSGTSGSDTFAGTAYLLGLLLTKAS